MADPTDLLNAWQDAIRDLGGMAASLVSRPVGAASELIGPMQRQAEQLERVLQRQLDFERELLARASAPARVALDLVEQAAAASRAQAIALRAAANSFAQLADLMEQQAELVERAGAAIRDPVSALRAAGAELRGNPFSASGEDPPSPPAERGQPAERTQPAERAQPPERATSGRGRARESGGRKRP